MLALAIDQESRPGDAVTFGDGLRDGAPRPATAVERKPDPQPRDQRVYPRALARGSADRRHPDGRCDSSDAFLAARVGAPAAPAGAGPGASPAKGRRHRAGGAAEPNRAFRRFMALLIFCIIFAVIVAVAISLATSASHTAVQFRQVVAHDAQSAINSVRGLINQYTK